jgi:hypothetical protein
MPTVNPDFNRTVARLDLDAERSGIFTPGVSAVSFTEADLAHFNDCVARVAPGTPQLDGTQIAGAARRLARAVGEGSQARFIQIRLRRAGELRALLRDKTWTCDETLRQRMIDLVAYIDGPQRLLPDDVPTVGGLDVALLVDFAMEHLRAELDQYADFCRYRQGEAERLGVASQDIPIDRASWEVERGEELRLERQVRRIRESTYARGGGHEEGFKVR